MDTAPTVEIEKPIFEEKEPNIKCEKKGKGNYLMGGFMGTLENL